MNRESYLHWSQSQAMAHGVIIRDARFTRPKIQAVLNGAKSLNDLNGVNVIILGVPHV